MQAAAVAGEQAVVGHLKVVIWHGLLQNIVVAVVEFVPANQNALDEFGCFVVADNVAESSQLIVVAEACHLMVGWREV